MGAGHDGAARELARRLEAAGHDVEVRDFLESAPLKIGSGLKWGYEFQIRHLAWSYELTYRLWYLLPFLCPPVARFVAWLTGRRMQRWARDFDADIVVSTYPLATVGLGQLRGQGKLDLPVVNFITDFGVHPLWVHPAVDLNLATHPKPAAEAARRTGQPAIATGPMVSPAFFRPQDREAARDRIGLGPDDRAVLIVAGSWGVGAVAETFKHIAKSGRYVPIAVCGHDDRLRRRLVATGFGRVLGWTDQMPALMAASDALIENAGGLTSMEALASGLPVVSFRAIAGHGRENTLSMQSVGVSRVAANPSELLAVLDEVTTDGLARQAMINAGRAMFVSDASNEVLAMADAASVPNTVEEILKLADATEHRRQRVPSRRMTRTAAALAILPVAWASVTFGVGVAAANGVGVAHPAGHLANVAYLAVRVDATQLNDPAVINELGVLHATAVVDERTARLDPTALRQLAAAKIEVANGGTGIRSNPKHTTMPWRRARADVLQSSRLIGAISGQPARLFVPVRRINGFDLLACRAAHSRAVVPNRVISANDYDLAELQARHIYLVDGTGSSVQRLLATLNAVSGELGAEHLSTATLASVR